MTRHLRPGCLALLAIGAVLGGAVVVGLILVGPQAFAPSDPARRRPVPVVAPVSDVFWDAEAERAAAALPVVPVRPGDEFRVTSEFPNDEVVAAVLAASRKALPLTLDLLGGRPRPQRRPCDVHVARTRARVREEARRGGWTPPTELLGFADLARSRIWLTSDDLDVPDDVLAAAGPGSVLTMVAGHEAAHQVAGWCLPGAGGADWLTEGLAEFVGEQVVMDTWPGTKVGEFPYFSRKMLACQRLLEAQRLPISTSIFLGRLDDLDPGSTYAIHWAFFRYLNEPANRDRTRTLISRIRELPWSEDIESRIFDEVDSTWSVTERESLTAGFHAYVAAFAPQWCDVDGRFEVSGATWTQVGRKGASDRAIRSTRPGRTDYSIRGAVEILDRGDKLAEVQLGETPAGWVYVGFQGEKSVALWVDPKFVDGHRDDPLIRQPDVKPAVGRRIEFVIDVTPDRLRVHIDGRQAMEWTPNGRDLTGRWGVSCGNYWRSTTPTESAAVWHNVRLE